MTQERTADRVAGGIMIGAAALAMLAMSHHPTSLHAGALIQIVHGAMILVVGALAFGFIHLARRLGLERPAVLAGLVAYAIAAAANIGAATINGFALPAFFADAPNAGHDLFGFAWALNQALAKLAVIAAGLAYILWSLALWRGARVVALLGFAAGIVPAILMLGGLALHVHAALFVYAAQMLWAALAGWLLLRGRLGAGQVNHNKT
jgi:hypothetical protein